MKPSKKSGVKAFDIPMRSACGWDLVSVPVIPKDKHVDSVFPGNCGVWAWVSNGYIEVDAIEPGVGYWVCYIEPRKVRVVGRPINAYKRPLAQGWNLIGAPFRRVDFFKLTNVPPYIIYGSLFGFDPTKCFFISATTIEPGRGYWVAAGQACTLTVPSLVKGVAAPKVIPLTWSFTLRLESDDRSKDLTIGITDEYDSLQDKSIPPVPPVVGFEKFDAYLEGNLQGRPRLTRSIKEADATITWSAFVKSYTSFTLSWDPVGIPTGYGFTLNIDGQRIDMKHQSSYSRKDTGSEYLRFKIIVLSL